MRENILFEKIVPGGKALGRRADGKAVFSMGIVPGELAEVEITREKKNYCDGLVINVMEPSKYRNATAESHYLSCAPWQQIDYIFQLTLKRAILSDAFEQYKIAAKIPDVLPSPQTVGYRNKLDFALIHRNGAYQLAFNERGSGEQLVVLESGCRLASERMNSLAMQVCTKLGELGITKAESLIVRQSTTTKAVLIHLVVSAGEQVDYSALMIKGLSSLIVTLSAKPPRMHGKVLLRAGEGELLENIQGLDFSFSYDAFFQTNVLAFWQVVKDIKSIVSPGRKIVELFGGVGVIGLSLASNASDVQTYEIFAPSITHAKRNIKRNKITNGSADILDAASISALGLKDIDTLIVDPPRSGLDKVTISTVLDARPQQIVYLSCDPVTLARDISLLSSGYLIKKLLAYDFYPGTPHIESLAILSRKA